MLSRLFKILTIGYRLDYLFDKIWRNDILTHP